MISVKVRSRTNLESMIDEFNLSGERSSRRWKMSKVMNDTSR
jgi:hypothetical protein